LEKEAMNVTRAFQRSVIALALLWSSYWGWQYWENAKAGDETQQVALSTGAHKAKDPRTGDPNHPDYSKEDAEYWQKDIDERIKLRDSYYENSERSLEWLWKGLIGIFAFSLAAAWVLAGLNSQKK
jgi:hypothetical protein